MKLDELAKELKENKEEKVIEATNVSIDELMPKLNEYKKLFEEEEKCPACGKMTSITCLSPTNINKKYITCSHCGAKLKADGDKLTEVK